MKILGNFSKFLGTAFLAVIISAGSVSAQVVVVDPSPAINAFHIDQIKQEIEAAADRLKQYKQMILEYKEQVSQGITQAKQLKQMYDNAKTFALDDLPHFASDLRADPVGTIRKYSSTLESMRRNVDRAYSILKNSKVTFGGGVCYSLDELTGLSPEKFSSVISIARNNDTKLKKEGEKFEEENWEYAGEVRSRYNMSLKDYYELQRLKQNLAREIAKILGASSKEIEEVNKKYEANQGFINEIQKMAVQEGISETEVMQLNVQASAMAAQAVNDVGSQIQSAVAMAVANQSAQEQLRESEANRKYTVSQAWKEELDRDDVPEWYDSDGSDWFPEVPSNRGIPFPSKGGDRK